MTLLTSSSSSDEAEEDHEGDAEEEDDVKVVGGVAQQTGIEAKEGAEDEFKCAVCMDILCEPVSLFCGHIFCTVCVDRAEVRTCPTCRLPCFVPPVHNLWIERRVWQHFGESIYAARKQWANEQRRLKLQKTEQEKLAAQIRKDVWRRVMQTVHHPRDELTAGPLFLNSSSSSDDDADLKTVVVRAAAASSSAANASEHADECKECQEERKLREQQAQPQPSTSVPAQQPGAPAPPPVPSAFQQWRSNLLKHVVSKPWETTLTPLFFGAYLALQYWYYRGKLMNARRL